MSTSNGAGQRAVSAAYARRRERNKVTRSLTPAGLDERMRSGSMGVEDLLRQVEPVLGQYSGWIVPGLDPEDILQELRVVAWKCHAGWDGQQASFINYLMKACNHRMAELARYSRRHQQPVQRLRCRTCAETRAPRGRGGRCRCGGTTWAAETSEHNLVSLSVLEEDRIADAVAQDVDLELLLGSLGPDAEELARRAIAGEPLLAREKRELRRSLGDDPDLLRRSPVAR